MILIVCGTFDDIGGKSSGYAEKLFADIIAKNKVDFINGSNFDKLLNIDFMKYQIIIWFADIPNSAPKIINTIKLKNPKCMLITSKRNVDEKYKPFDLIERALNSKSNLLVEFTCNHGKVSATLWDALGNVYLNKCEDIHRTAQALSEKIFDFGRVRRIASKKIGEATSVPNESRFFALARQYADKFHSLVHAVNTSRFVGNLSFRCQHGFPSFKSNDLVYVSRRNIDKRGIDQEGFVPVSTKSFSPIKYYGLNKPSVDTPIQVLLYDMMPKIKYMIHSHAYIKNAEFTDNIVPCGDLREVWKVRDALVRSGTVVENVECFTVNLKGHGSLIGSSSVESLQDIDYYARPIPEYLDIPN